MVFEWMDDVQVTENKQLLTHPFAGGLNLPRFSQIDLNGDGKLDLFLFDRHGNQPLTFLNEGQTDEAKYRHAPEYEQYFPKLYEWALLRDYNCDGKPDIFCAENLVSGITIYKNTSDATGLKFTKMVDTLSGGSLPAYVALTDVPEVVDMDNDGDLDIVSFDPAGKKIVLYKSMAMENTGGCDDLTYITETTCWGDVEEESFTNTILLDIACKANTLSFPDPDHSQNVHSGSTICAIDQEGDGAKELLLGDLSFRNIVYLHNDGTENLAHIDTVDYNFPSYDVPINIFLFPASFHLDIDNDGLKDWIVAPNASNIAANYEDIYFYKNVGDASNTLFSYQRKAFLQSEMIECGSYSKPVFFDYDGDGLLDLVIGNRNYVVTNTNQYSGLTLYKNIGTATEPEFELIDRNYLNIPSMFNPPIIDIHPAFGDLDNDGDMDMVLGDGNGEVFEFTNTAGSGNVANFQYASNFEGMDVGQNATPQIIDVNRDGKPDLVVGEYSGNLNYFQNIGTPTDPDFDANSDTAFFGGIDVMINCCTGFSVPYMFENENGEYELLVSDEFGEVLHYTDIEEDLLGTFTLSDSSYGNINRGGNLSISGADINNDGKLEFIVGNIRGGVNLYKQGAADTTSTNIEAGISPYTVSLFPNPSQAPSFTLNFGQTVQKADIEIFSLTGKRIAHHSIENASSHQPQMNELPAGIYLVKLLLDDTYPIQLKWVHIQP